MVDEARFQERVLLLSMTGRMIDPEDETAGRYVSL